MHKALSLLLALFCFAGCQQPPANEDSGAPAMAAEELAKWRSEIIELPSQFAPGLPKGVEELRFAPGMYEASAEDYWSYCFVLRFDEAVVGQPAVQSLLEQYYKGLITAVAKSRNVTLDREAAVVQLEALSENRYRAKVDLVDAFVTGRPLTIHMDIELRAKGSGTQVRARVSPQRADHDVWKSLTAVLATLE